MTTFVAVMIIWVGGFLHFGTEIIFVLKTGVEVKIFIK